MKHLQSLIYPALVTLFSSVIGELVFLQRITTNNRYHPLQSACAHGERVHSCMHAGRTCNHYCAAPQVVKNPTGRLSFCIIWVNLFYPLSAVAVPALQGATGSVKTG